MKNRKHGTILMIVMMTVLLSLAGGLSAFASKGAPMTPELAAKRNMVRKQEEQRITPEKRKTAVEGLKAERRKIYKAKQAALKDNK